MCDSASSADEANDAETFSTVLVASCTPPPAQSKRSLKEATTVSHNPAPRRVRRKASDFGQVGGQFSAADPDEEDGPAPQASPAPPLHSEPPQDASVAAAALVAVAPPEVNIMPETRCSFGSEMVARPMDLSNIRELVNAREEQVETVTADGQATSGNDKNDVARGSSHCVPAGHEDLATSSADDSVETAAVGGGGQVVKGFRYGGNEVDPFVCNVPLLLLGQKRTSKDKFYDFHEAMRRENMAFLVATMKDEDGGLVYPLKCNLHEVVFNKQDALRDLIHERWFGDPSSILTFVKSCLQVSQTRPDGNGTNVCLYLRVEAEVVSGLDGDAAACARFGELKEGTGCGEAGLVIALDDVTVKKINQCREAASFLHPEVVASVSVAKRQKKSDTDAPPPATRYVRLDDLPLSGDKEEHPSFKFRLKPKAHSKESKRKQAASRNGILVSSGGGEAEAGTVAGNATASNVSSAPPPAKPDLGPVTPPPLFPAARTEPAETTEAAETTEVTAPSSALVVRSSEADKIQNATEDEKAVWMDAGSALNVVGVQRPTLPRFPTTVLLKVDPKKISMQPWGDGEVVLLIQP